MATPLTIRAVKAYANVRVMRIDPLNGFGDVRDSLIGDRFDAENVPPGDDQVSCANGEGTFV